MSLKTITAKDMQLRDVVRMVPQDGIAFQFGDCAVIRTSADEVELFRPYIHTDDVVLSSGKGGQSVIEYIGTEQYTLLRDSHVKYFLLERNTLR